MAVPRSPVEQRLIDTSAELGVETVRVPGRRGVWVAGDGERPDRKIASVGIRVARGVSMHGFALNCDCDLSHFDRIVPCGTTDAGVTSLSMELGRRVTVDEVLAVVERHLPTLLADWTPAPAEQCPGRMRRRSTNQPLSRHGTILRRTLAV